MAKPEKDGYLAQVETRQAGDQHRPLFSLCRMIVMFIENVSLENVRRGYHFDPGENSMLIQIVDPDMDFPQPLYNFKEIHQFKFLDLEEDDEAHEDLKITNEQAKTLVTLLQHAYDNCMNVIVHCHAGVCRSGAVAEVGVALGFEDTHVFRAPNLLVKHKMMKALEMCDD